MLPWEPTAQAGELGHPLCFPRAFQGAGRHDNPELYGCLYAAEEPVSSVAEALAPFRGTGALDDAMLVRFGARLALAELRVDDDAGLVDLDDPRVLAAEELRPSLVATRRRATTQRSAAELHDRHAHAVGLRWWSTLEASWLNVTLFDRAARRTAVGEVALLDADQPAVREAAACLGLL